MIRRAPTLLVLLAFVSGCAADGAPHGPQSLAERVVHEAFALRELLTGTGVLFFPLVVLLGFGLSRLLRLVVRAVARLRMDPGRKLAGHLALWNFVIATLVLWLIAGRLVTVAPLLALVGLGLGLAVLTAALREQIQDIVVGLMLVARRRLREGDRAEIGEQSGIVRRVGLTRVELRRGDGTVVYIPTRLLGAGALVIGHARHTVPVAAVVSVAPERSQQAAERALRTALCSPYRASATPVEVSPEPDGRLRVQIHAWSERAASDAAAQLELALSRELGG